MRRGGTRVHQAGGNRSGLTGYRSNRSGPVPVWAGTKPAQIQNSNLNSEKKIQKIPKNTSRCDESNGVKKFSKIRPFSIVCGDLKLNKKNVHIKVYKYNVKVVQKRVGGFI